MHIIICIHTEAYTHTHVCSSLSTLSINVILNNLTRHRQVCEPFPDRERERLAPIFDYIKFLWLDTRARKREELVLEVIIKPLKQACALPLAPPSLFNRYKILLIWHVKRVEWDDNGPLIPQSKFLFCHTFNESGNWCLKYFLNLFNPFLLCTLTHICVMLFSSSSRSPQKITERTKLCY